MLSSAYLSQKLWMLYMTGEAFLCAYDFLMINCLLNSHDCCIFSAERKYWVAVAGRGMQMVEFLSAENDEEEISK